MSLVHTREDLKVWGAWMRGGLPTIPSMFASIMGGPKGQLSLDAPEKVQWIDGIVCRAEPEDRQILIVRYVFKGSPREKSRMLGHSERTYYRKLEKAEWFVHVELDEIPLDCVAEF